MNAFWAICTIFGEKIAILLKINVMIRIFGDFDKFSAKRRRFCQIFGCNYCYYNSFCRFFGGKMVINLKIKFFSKLEDFISLPTYMHLILLMTAAGPTLSCEGCVVVI
jgi:hypothetical protein